MIGVKEKFLLKQWKWRFNDLKFQKTSKRRKYNDGLMKESYTEQGVALSWFQVYDGLASTALSGLETVKIESRGCIQQDVSWARLKVYKSDEGQARPNRIRDWVGLEFQKAPLESLERHIKISLKKLLHSSLKVQSLKH